LTSLPSSFDHKVFATACGALHQPACASNLVPRLRHPGEPSANPCTSATHLMKMHNRLSTLDFAALDFGALRLQNPARYHASTHDWVRVERRLDVLQVRPARPNSVAPSPRMKKKGKTPPPRAPKKERKKNNLFGETPRGLKREKTKKRKRRRPTEQKKSLLVLRAMLIENADDRAAENFGGRSQESHTPQWGECVDLFRILGLCCHSRPRTRVSAHSADMEKPRPCEFVSWCGLCSGP